MEFELPAEIGFISLDCDLLDHYIEAWRDAVNLIYSAE